MRIARSRVLATVGIGIALVVVASGVYALRAAPPGFQSEQDGIALGPAGLHSQARTDIVIQIATTALTSAAGDAGGDLASATLNLTPNAQEQALLSLTNADRQQNGLPPVNFDAASMSVARVRAAAQISDGPLSHYNSLGELAFVGLLADAGVQYTLAGENLARASMDDQTTVSRLNDALMNSPEHRANILEPKFDWLAVGAASGPDGRIALAEIFRSDGDQ